MNSKTNKPKPIYFSDYFKVDKAKLKELGVFDPILNFDTKLFVDPTPNEKLAFCNLSMVIIFQKIVSFCKSKQCPGFI